MSPPGLIRPAIEAAEWGGSTIRKTETAQIGQN
jgi:hypothetical protein